MTPLDRELQAPFQDADGTVAIRRIQIVKQLTPEQLDELPFGVIQVDREGNVLAYNRTEAELAGLDAERVVGKNFFTEVAPCTNVQGFAGRFREEFERDSHYVVFPYRFEFEHRPLQVAIFLHTEKEQGRGWILVQKADGA